MLYQGFGQWKTLFTAKAEQLEEDTLMLTALERYRRDSNGSSSIAAFLELWPEGSMWQLRHRLPLLSTQASIQ